MTETLPLPLRPPVSGVRAAIGDVELARVAARVEPVRADAGGDEPDFLERVAIHYEYAVGVHVGDVEDSAVRRDPNVLRHAGWRLRAPSCDRLV